MLPSVILSFVGVKKATQELYGLINFGELRKKIGGTLDERKAQKLQELIRKGSTSVRVKGKSVRVRTPICRALKKLNQIEGADLFFSLLFCCHFHHDPYFRVLSHSSWPFCYWNETKTPNLIPFSISRAPGTSRASGASHCDP